MPRVLSAIKDESKARKMKKRDEAYLQYQWQLIAYDDILSGIVRLANCLPV